MSIAITATARENQGKGASRRLRTEGLVPAIVYGGNGEPAAVAFAANELNKAIENPAFFTGLIDLTVADKTETVIVKAFQRHPAKPEVLHVDLQRVSEDKAITTRVPLRFVGANTSEGVKAQGGRLVVEAKLAEVRCLPANLPSELEVDMSAAQLGQIFHLSDAALPEGVQLVALLKGKDHDQPIARITKSKR